MVQRQQIYTHRHKHTHAETDTGQASWFHRGGYAIEIKRRVAAVELQFEFTR